MKIKAEAVNFEDKECPDKKEWWRILKTKKDITWRDIKLARDKDSDYWKTKICENKGREVKQPIMTSYLNLQNLNVYLEKMVLYILIL